MTADRRRDAFSLGAAEGPGSDPADCALVISSCDKYQDLWNPSLALHRRFWPDCPYPTFLMSETVPVGAARPEWVDWLRRDEVHAMAEVPIRGEGLVREETVSPQNLLVGDDVDPAP